MEARHEESAHSRVGHTLIWGPGQPQYILGGDTGNA
jgi:hypothetical protein